jgi:hypothetical protein
MLQAEIGIYGENYINILRSLMLQLKGKDKPGHAHRANRISRQSAYKCGKVVSPKHRPPLPPGNIPGTHFSYRLTRPQGHSEAGKIN